MHKNMMMPPTKTDQLTAPMPGKVTLPTSMDNSMPLLSLGPKTSISTPYMAQE